MSKNYAGVRIKKYSNVGSASWLINHHLRLVAVANADPKRLHLNETLFRQPDIFEFLNEVPKGSKKNSCRFVDVVFYASYFDTDEQLANWTKQTLEHIKKEFGEENLALVQMHKDETTEHIHVIFKPVNPKTKKLGAGHWFDGRLKMKAFQTRYCKSVENLGFVRGEEGKRAYHQDLDTYYKQVNKHFQEAEAEYDAFKTSLLAIKTAIEQVSIIDLIKPKKFVQKMMPLFKAAAKNTKNMIQLHKFQQTEEKEKRLKRSLEEIEQMKTKLQAVTGYENPSWTTIHSIQKALKVDDPPPTTSGGGGGVFAPQEVPEPPKPKTPEPETQKQKTRKFW